MAFFNCKMKNDFKKDIHMHNKHGKQVEQVNR